MSHGGQVNEFARRHGIRVEDILDFSANINPLGPPDSALRAIEQSLPRLTHYPDATHHDVKASISIWLDIDTANILCGNGATEVMELLFRHIAPRRIIVFDPAFSEYHLIANRIGAELVRIPLQRRTRSADETFALPLQQLRQLASAGDLVVINNPHNPTSTCWHPDVWFRDVEALCHRGVFVAVDESFIDFLPKSNELSVAKQATRQRNLFVIRSATKIFSIPGLRFGYGIGDADLVNEIGANRDGWSVNAMAQAAATQAMRDHAFLEQTHHWLQTELAYVMTMIQSLPNVHAYTPSVNFVLTEFCNAKTALDVVQRLEQQAILSRACHDFHGLDHRHIRFAIRTRAENQRLWQAISQALQTSP